MTSLKERLAKLGDVPSPTIDLSLDRVQALLAALGNPHLKLPPVIHVAGTNGKGSLIAYLRAMLNAAGLGTHIYTSPYLVRFHEQIILNNKIINDEYLIDILDKVIGRLNEYSVTFFEASTIAAFIAFAEQKADAVLLETGLGGRLDATNVIPRPALTAITPVSLDHQEFLGNSLAAIAGEKAGILKTGVTCVVGPQSPEALSVIEEKARTLNAPLYRFGKEWNVEINAKHFRYHSASLDREFPLPALVGAHQVYNAATAIACVEQLKNFSITPKHIEEGLANAVWPARLQRLMRGPLVNLAGDAELWLDGAHNPDAAKALAGWMKEQQDRPLFVIAGMLRNKDAKNFFAAFAPFVTALATVSIPQKAESHEPEALAAIAAQAGINAFAAESVKAAIMQINARSGGNPCRILICGSLYLAGHILSEND